MLRVRGRHTSAHDQRMRTTTIYWYERLDPRHDPTTPLKRRGATAQQSARSGRFHGYRTHYAQSG